ncbi:hypothetical protein GCM10012286_52320 [Streptomyces lasiicapitis]|uniref:Uncharacterized protein n=1 Tax=Streptomyces lasiicapitis TaxID=1923961 RepID=A0ABQ2MG23_9ACTN|nr:hypothetical protein GCM10012286_52320 [Streptomyces lasiicapitis]
MPDTAKDAASAPSAITDAIAPTARTAGSATTAVFFQLVLPSGNALFAVLTVFLPYVVPVRKGSAWRCAFGSRAGPGRRRGSAILRLIPRQLETRAEIE